MTSIPVRGVKLKDGRLVKKPPRMAPVLARGQKHKADREEKAWLAKTERFTPDEERRLKAMQDHLAAKARGKG